MPVRRLVSIYHHTTSKPTPASNLSSTTTASQRRSHPTAAAAIADRLGDRGSKRFGMHADDSWLWKRQRKYNATAEDNARGDKDVVVDSQDAHDSLASGQCSASMFTSQRGSITTRHIAESAKGGRTDSRHVGVSNRLSRNNTGRKRR